MKLCLVPALLTHAQQSAWWEREQYQNQFPGTRPLWPSFRNKTAGQWLKHQLREVSTGSLTCADPLGVGLSTYRREMWPQPGGLKTEGRGWVGHHSDLNIAALSQGTEGVYWVGHSFLNRRVFLYWLFNFFGCPTSRRTSFLVLISHCIGLDGRQNPTPAIKTWRVIYLLSRPSLWLGLSMWPRLSECGTESRDYREFFCKGRGSNI